MRIITEEEFREELKDMLDIELSFPDAADIGVVTGPGRSGAVAAVYASHILGVPFIPYGSKAPTHLGRLLIIDTAAESGATLRKAVRKYEAMGHTPLALAVYDEADPEIGRVAFWYESPKPQRYKHEKTPRYSQKQHSVFKDGEYYATVVPPDKQREVIAALNAIPSGTKIAPEPVHDMPLIGQAWER